MVRWQTCTCFATPEIVFSLLISCLISAFGMHRNVVQHSSLVMPMKHPTPVAPTHKLVVTYKLPPAIHIRSLWVAPAVACYVTGRSERAARHALHVQWWCPGIKDILSSGAHGCSLIHKLKRVSIRHLWQASQQFACLNEMSLWGRW